VQDRQSLARKHQTMRYLDRRRSIYALLLKADADMKRLITVVLIALAGLTCSATAQTFQGNVPLLAIQYAREDVPPVRVEAVYSINGVNYPVDYNRRIWGRSAYGRWEVIGRIESKPYGDIAITGFGRYPATRVE
jgi:hypothetical protein